MISPFLELNLELVFPGHWFDLWSLQDLTGQWPGKYLVTRVQFPGGEINPSDNNILLIPRIQWMTNYCFLSSSCAIPETGFGSSPHIPVLSVCFSCSYTGIWDRFRTLGSLPLLSKRRRLKYRTAEITSRTGVLVLSGPTHWPLSQSPPLFSLETKNSSSFFHGFGSWISCTIFYLFYLFGLYPI